MVSLDKDDNLADGNWMSECPPPKLTPSRSWAGEEQSLERFVRKVSKCGYAQRRIQIGDVKYILKSIFYA